MNTKDMALEINHYESQAYCEWHDLKYKVDVINDEAIQQFCDRCEEEIEEHSKELYCCVDCDGG